MEPNRKTADWEERLVPMHPMTRPSDSTVEIKKEGRALAAVCRTGGSLYDIC